MKWNKKTDILALMVGHGKSLDGTWDSGCTYGKYTEAELMLPIVKVAVKMLRKSGVRVITDADKGNDRNMKSSVAWSDRIGCKRYISLHCDWSGASAGVAPLYKTTEDKEMAQTIGKYVAKKMGMKYKGVFYRSDLYELNAPHCPSVIFESGSIKADLKYLKDYKKYGRALAQGICKYIGVKYVSKTQGEKLATECDKLITKMNNLHFKYKNAYLECGTSWDKAKKTRKSNCATMVSWALQNMGVLDKGQIFWINGDKVTYKGDGCKKNLTKATDELHPHKKPKDAKLKKGDICGYDSPHTMVFAGWKDKKKTVPLWYSWGGTDVGDKQPKTKKTYTSRKIDTILRLKND